MLTIDWLPNKIDLFARVGNEAQELGAALFLNPRVSFQFPSELEPNMWLAPWLCMANEKGILK